MTDLTLVVDNMRLGSATEVAELLLNDLFLTYQTKGPAEEEKRKRLLVNYVKAVGVFPIAAIEAAIWKFNRGEVPDRKKGMLPTTEELCAVIRECLRGGNAATKERQIERPRNPTAFQLSRPDLYPEIFGQGARPDEMLP